MKRFTILALLVALFTMGIQARGKQPIVFKNLPDTVKAVVLKNYTEDQIHFITSQRIMPRRYVYEFTLADNTQFKYDKKARLKKIYSPEGVPAALMPEAINTYVANTFPHTIITGYQPEMLCHKVKLDDKMTLIFSKKGKFIRIDD